MVLLLLGCASQMPTGTGLLERAGGPFVCLGHLDPGLEIMSVRELVATL